MIIAPNAAKNNIYFQHCNPDLTGAKSNSQKWALGRLSKTNHKKLTPQIKKCSIIKGKLVDEEVHACLRDDTNAKSTSK